MFIKEFEGNEINNQSGYSAVDTGYYFTDHHGCWHKLRITEITDKSATRSDFGVGSEIYMIGEYPKEGEN